MPVTLGNPGLQPISAHVHQQHEQYTAQIVSNVSSYKYIMGEFLNFNSRKEVEQLKLVW